MILDGKAEEVLVCLSREYHVSVPKIKVGLPKKSKKKAFGCYDARSQTISILNSDVLKDPFVILHEFYHHLRTTADHEHRGTEKYANKFAMEFIEAYRFFGATRAGND